MSLLVPPLPNSSKGKIAPFTSNYRPELDATGELTDDDHGWYMELVGILRWAVELGRIDIQYEVTALSSYIASPREGHLPRARFVRIRRK